MYVHNQFTKPRHKYAQQCALTRKALLQNPGSLTMQSMCFRHEHQAEEMISQGTDLV